MFLPTVMMMARCSEMDTTTPQLLRPAEASAYLRVAERTLANWRTKGEGPRFLKLGGRVFYSTEELDRWKQARTYSSTSSYRAV
jgi:hypothetical protein